MARKAHYTRRKQYNPLCRVCGTKFIATRADACYCSPACRKAISRAMLIVANVVKNGMSLKEAKHKNRVGGAKT